MTIDEAVAAYSLNVSCHNLRKAVVSLGVSAEQATVGLLKMKRALVLIDAPTKAGDWPDSFSLLNRYLRTDLEPENITGERWES